MAELAADRGEAVGHIGGRDDVHGEAEPVEQLRSQLALLGIHRSDQHEAGVVDVRHAVALDAVGAGHGRVEQRVDQVVGQQVDLVDVQDAPVGGGHQAPAEPGRRPR